MESLRIGGLFTTVIVHMIVVGMFFGASSQEQGCGGEAKADDKPPLKMRTIEASLAYKAKEQPKQPQKKARRPRPKVKPEGVSRDADKIVDPDKKKKPEPKDAEVDYSKQLEKFMEQRQADEDDVELDDPEEVRPGGAFNGSEHGFAEVSKGDPYMQELAADVFNNWKVPTLEKGAGDAVGCIRLLPDGSVMETKLWKRSQNTNIDRSVEDALMRLSKARKPGKEPVPKHLMDVTNEWTCFNFNVESQ